MNGKIGYTLILSIYCIHLVMFVLKKTHRMEISANCRGWERDEIDAKEHYPNVRYGIYT